MSQMATTIAQLLLGGLETGVGLGVDLPNQRDAERRRREAQTGAIDAAGQAAGRVAGIGTGIAQNYRNAMFGGDYRQPGPDGQFGTQDDVTSTGPGYVADWRSNNDRVLNEWYNGRGGAQGTANRVRNEGETARTNTQRTTTDTLQRGYQRASGIQQEQRGLMDNDIARADAYLQQNQQQNKMLLEKNDADFQQVRQDIFGFLDKAGGDYQQLVGYLSKGVANQISAATAGVRTQKAQALAQFDASWQGPRDQNYQAQRRAVEGQFNGQMTDQMNQIMEVHRTNSSNTLQQAQASLNGLRASSGSSIAGLASTKMQAQTEIGLRDNADRASMLGFIDSARNRFANVQTQLNQDLTGLDTAAMEAMTSVEKDIFNNATQAAFEDQAFLTQYANAQTALHGTELALRAETEASYASMLTGFTNMAAGFTQMGLEFMFNQEFGTPLVSPYFGQMGNRIGAIADQQLQAQQIQAYESANRNNFWGNITGGLIGAGGQVGAAALG
jgi:hypothetical protein